MIISTGEELQFLLHRGWEIEKKFEYLSAWKGFVKVNSAYRKVVLTLAMESEKHRIALENVLKSLGLEAPVDVMPEAGFDFSGKVDAEILGEIVRQDKIVWDLYAEITESTDPKLILSLSNKEAVELFYETFTQMMKDEERHIKLAQNLAGKVKRIQATKL